MKKLILSTVILAFTFISVNSQVVKDNIPEELSSNTIYTVNTYSLLPKSNIYAEYTSNGTVEKYYILTGNSQTPVITFYNLDYSVFKSLNLPAGAYVSWVTTKMFNTDANIEFLCKVNNSFKLFDENGVIIYDFIDDYPSCVTLNSNGEFKLYSANSTTGKRSIYSLSKQSTKLNIISDNPCTNPYPNPAKQIINLPYQLEQGKQATMKIVDVNGKQITTKLIDSTFDKILLDVSAYQKGLYIYEYNGKSGKFLVE